MNCLQILKYWWAAQQCDLCSIRTVSLTSSYCPPQYLNASQLPYIECLSLIHAVSSTYAKTVSYGNFAFSFTIYISKHHNLQYLNHSKLSDFLLCSRWTLDCWGFEVHEAYRMLTYRFISYWVNDHGYCISKHNLQNLGRSRHESVRLIPPRYKRLWSIDVEATCLALPLTYISIRRVLMTWSLRCCLQYMSQSERRITISSSLSAKGLLTISYTRLYFKGLPPNSPVTDEAVFGRSLLKIFSYALDWLLKQIHASLNYPLQYH